MIINVLISLIGWLLAYRILSVWDQKNLVSSRVQQKILFFYSVLAIFCEVYFRNLKQMAWLVQFIAIIFLLVGPLIIEIRRRKHFRQLLISNLDLILLQMKSGKAFREVLASFINKKSNTDYVFSEICDGVISPQRTQIAQSNQSVIRVYKEFLKIDQQRYKKIDCLNSFRHQLKIEEKFRRKSRNAQMQARAQSVVISILYFLCLIFVCIEYGLRAHLTIIATSLLLFLLGIVWTARMGRKMKWKV